MAGGVDSDIPVCEHFVSLVGAPQDHVHTGEEFQGFKGLYDIVLSAQTQSFDLVSDVLLGCQENNGSTAAFYLVHDLKTVHTRQHDVQEDKVIAALHSLLSAGNAVIAAMSFIVYDRECSLYHVSNVFIVLNN